MSDKRRVKIDKFLQLANPADDPSWQAFSATSDPIPSARLQGIFADAVAQSAVVKPAATGGSSLVTTVHGATDVQNDQEEP